MNDAELGASVMRGREIMNVDWTKHPQYKEWVRAAFIKSLVRWFK